MNLPSEMHVVVVERDLDPEWMKRHPAAMADTPRGPMSWETYFPKTQEQARSDAENLAGKYGEHVVCKLVAVREGTVTVTLTKEQAEIVRFALGRLWSTTTVKNPDWHMGSKEIEAITKLVEDALK